MNRQWLNRKYTGVAASALLVVDLGITAFASGGFSSWNTVLPISGGSTAAGTLSLSSGSTNTLTQAVSNLAPGESVEMPGTVVNNGSLPIGSISLSVATSNTSALATDTSSSDGLNLTVQSCPSAWSPSTTTVNGVSVTTYSCSQGSTTYINAVAIGSLTSTSNAITSTGVAVLPSTSMNYLFTVALGSSTPVAEEGQAVSLTYNFVGTQAPSGAVG